MEKSKAKIEIRAEAALSPAEAAKLLGIGKTLLYEQLASGDLPSSKIGKRRVIQVKEIESFLNRKRALL